MEGEIQNPTKMEGEIQNPSSTEVKGDDQSTEEKGDDLTTEVKGDNQSTEVKGEVEAANGGEVEAPNGVEGIGNGGQVEGNDDYGGGELSILDYHLTEEDDVNTDQNQSQKDWVLKFLAERNLEDYRNFFEDEDEDEGVPQQQQTTPSNDDDDDDDWIENFLSRNNIEDYPSFIENEWVVEQPEEQQVQVLPPLEPQEQQGQVLPPLEDESPLRCNADELLSFLRSYVDDSLPPTPSGKAAILQAAILQTKTAFWANAPAKLYSAATLALQSKSKFKNKKLSCERYFLVRRSYKPKEPNEGSRDPQNYTRIVEEISKNTKELGEWREVQTETKVPLREQEKGMEEQEKGMDFIYYKEYKNWSHNFEWLPTSWRMREYTIKDPEEKKYADYAICVLWDGKVNDGKGDA